MNLNKLCTLKIPNERNAEDDNDSAGEWIPVTYTDRNCFCAVNAVDENSVVYPEGSRIAGQLKITVRYDRTIMDNRLFLGEGRVIYNGNSYRIYGYEEEFEEGYRYHYLNLFCGGPRPE